MQLNSATAASSRANSSHFSFKDTLSESAADYINKCLTSARRSRADLFHCSRCKITYHLMTRFSTHTQTRLVDMHSMIAAEYLFNTVIM